MLQQIFNYYITKSRMSGESENTILILTKVIVKESYSNTNRKVLYFN